MPISPELWKEIQTVQGNFNQLLGIANPSTASTLGGEVVGGVPLLGGFYPTPTPLAANPISVDPSSSRTTLGARPTPPSTVQPPPSRSPVSLGTPSTQIPRTTNIPAPFSPTPPPVVTNAPYTPIIATQPDSPLESNFNLPNNSPDRIQIPAGAIVGIALGALLLVFTILLGCWHIQRRRRATLAKRRTQRESFLHNPILSTLMVPKQSSSSFRGTPYLGEGDMYYANPPSLNRNSSSSFGPAFRQSHRPLADTAEGARLNEVNYLEVVGDHPRVDSLLPMKYHGGPIMHPQIEQAARFSNTYNNNTSQYFPQDTESEASDDNGSFQTRRSTFRSGFSTGSLIFPQVAKFRNVATNEAGIPIQNLEANRVKSQMVTDILDFDGQEYEQESDPGNRDSQKVDPDFPSFYLPPAGDPKKISAAQVDLPTQNLLSRITNFSYPMPRVVPSPPEVPGPILNRPRYKYGQKARRDQDLQPSRSPPSPPNPPSPPSPPTSPPSPLNEIVTRPGSTATPGFANNRYIPNKGKKRKTNANVLSVLHKSSLRKSSAKSMMPRRQSALSIKSIMAKRQSAVSINSMMPKRQSFFRRAERKTMASVSSVDIPDPYGHSKINHAAI